MAWEYKIDSMQHHAMCDFFWAKFLHFVAQKREVKCHRCYLDICLLKDLQSSHFDVISRCLWVLFDETQFQCFIGWHQVSVQFDLTFISSFNVLSYLKPSFLHMFICASVLNVVHLLMCLHLQKCDFFLFSYRRWCFPPSKFKLNCNFSMKCLLIVYLWKE